MIDWTSQATLQGSAARLWQRVKDLPFSGIIDIIAKLAAPAAVILAALLAQSFQSSLSTSQMLTAREQSDTQIRAEMFKAITEKLLGTKELDSDPMRKAVFTELLALNFHEHFQLKPLLTEVDDALRRQHDNERDKAQQALIQNRQYELLSVVRQVRARQTAMLLKPPYEVNWFEHWMPSYFVDHKVDQENYMRGKIKMLSVRFSGQGLSQDAPSACDVPKEEQGSHAYVGEPMEVNAPDGKGVIFISVNQPKDWKRETFTFRVLYQERTNKESAVPIKPIKTDALPTSASGAVEFDITQFDLPMTDNTMLPSGSRYAIFIDSICPDGRGSGVVKFALMWFPKDYFPPRERPTNYQELRQKLNVPLDQ